MYIYADESGNSGKNIFDEASPIYRLGAILTVQDAESAVGRVIQPILEASGKDRLHAKDMREGEVAHIASSLLDALDSLGHWRFSLQIIMKPYIATAKFVDMVFDSGENVAVPPLWYNLELFRHGLCVAIDDMLTDRNRRAFWDAYLRDDVGGIQRSIRNAGTYLTRKVSDWRVREVIKNAFDFAHRHPNEFTLSSSERKQSYQGHTPNLISFFGLLREVHRFVDASGSKPIAFYHDKQDEFRRSMREAHELFGPLKYRPNSKGMIPEVELAVYDLGQFSMPSSKDMVVLQAADILVWTSQRKATDENLKIVQTRLSKSTDDFYISRSMSEMIVASRMHQNASLPVSQSGLLRGQQMLDLDEELRRMRVQMVRQRAAQ